MTSAETAKVHVDDDAQLAVAAAAGDSVAFGAIYDRYADRLYDFCVGMLRDREAAADCVQDVFVTASTKLALLREPDRLRSWLYAIARHEAIGRLNARRREELTDTMPDQASTEPGTEAMAVRHELADLIDQACGGLTDRDRTVLELTYRHGLDGTELADALGVSHTNANTLVGRLRENIQRSLGALLVARHTVADPQACPTLAEILHGWDGQLTVLMRKRIARHIDDLHGVREPIDGNASTRWRYSAVRRCSSPRRNGCAEQVVKLCAFGLSMAAVGIRERCLRRQRRPRIAADDESWWPPVDFDISDLEDETTTHPWRCCMPMASRSRRSRQPDDRCADHSVAVARRRCRIDREPSFLTCRDADRLDCAACRRRPPRSRPPPAHGRRSPARPPHRRSLRRPSRRRAARPPPRRPRRWHRPSPMPHHHRSPRAVRPCSGDRLRPQPSSPRSLQ